MEKELARYRRTLKMQTGFFAAGAAVLLALAALGGLEIISPVGGGRGWTGAWQGFLSGCSTALAILLAAGAARNLRAMRDPEKLRRQYIRCHDERTQEIFRRAGKGSYWFDALGLLLATVIVGYFSPAAALACLGCTLYVCVVRLVLKLYYSRVL